MAPLLAGTWVPLVLALGGFTAAGPAENADAEPASTAASSEDADFARARTLFNSGRAKYDMGDYDGAIEDWTESYSLVQNKPGAVEIQTALVYNVTKAQREAYEVDKDVRRLRLARQLLQRGRVYHEQVGDTDEVARIDEELANLDAKIAAHEAQAGNSGAATGGGAGEGPADPSAGSSDPARPSDDGRKPVKSKVWFISGGAAMGVGAVGLGLMAGGMVMGSNAEAVASDPMTSIDDRIVEIDNGYIGNALAVTGGIVGGVGIVAGTALIVMGVKAKQREKAQSARITPTLQLDTRNIGFGLKGSF